MKREFLESKPPFRPGLLYRDKGQTEWKPLSSMPEHEQCDIINRLLQDFRGKRIVNDARSRGAKTPLDILTKVIPTLWGKLTPEFDIDENSLNFETKYYG